MKKRNTSMKLLADIPWLHLGKTNEYNDIKKFIADICYDVARSASIDEICINDICVGFRMHDYEIVEKAELAAAQAEVERLRAALENIVDASTRGRTRGEMSGMANRALEG